MEARSSSGFAATGDEVDRLYAEYGAKLYRFCLGRLRSNEEAEDAVQSTFLRVYTALRQGIVPRYEAAWLYKIAHNVCLSRIESAARRARIESPRGLTLVEERIAAPAVPRDELVGLAGALASMPPNLRRAILLREWQGLTYAEIAEALDVSVSAVESLIFRGRRWLADALVEPARRVAGALNLSWIAAGLRSLVTGGGAGAKVAAAVALLAAGGTGAGLGLIVGAPEQPRPSAVVRAAAPTASRAVAAFPTAGTTNVDLVGAGPQARPAVRRSGPRRAAPAVMPAATRPMATSPPAPVVTKGALPIVPTVATPTSTAPPPTTTPPPTITPPPPTITQTQPTTTPTRPQPPTVSVPSLAQTVPPLPVVDTPVAVTVTVPALPVVPALPPVTIGVTVPAISIPIVTLPLP